MQKPRTDTPAEAATPQHLVGYARVSREDQDNQRQIDALLRFGVNKLDIFQDKASGGTMKRPGWQALWKDIRQGDLVVVHALDRLGRDLVQLIHTVADMETRGVGLKVLTDNIDTRSASGRLVFHIIAAMAQWERDLIRERTMHGLASARTRGKMGGRPPTVTPEKAAEALRRMHAGELRKDIAAEYGVTRQGLDKAVKEYLRRNPSGRGRKQ